MPDPAEMSRLMANYHDLDDRLKMLSSNFADHAQKEQVLTTGLHEVVERLSFKLSRQDVQLEQILDAMTALGGSPSGFVGLAQEVGFSFRFTKRLLKWLFGLAAGLGTVWALRDHWK
jgi:hypothetical protein